MPEAETTKIQDIQVLRAAGAILVLMQHLSLGPTLAGRITESFTPPFYLGVEIFFIISGYVVTGLLFRDDRQAGAAPFLLRRIFRLYPALLIFLALSLISGHLCESAARGTGAHGIFDFEPYSFAEQGLAILGGYFINIKKDVSLHANGAMWSLSVEFQFYLAYAAIWQALSLGKLRGRRRQVVAATSVCLLFLCLCQRALSVRSHGLDNRLLNYLVAHNFDFMLAGVALAAWRLLGEAAERESPDAENSAVRGLLKRFRRILPEYRPHYAGFLMLPPLWLGSHMPSPLVAEGRALREGVLMPLAMLCFSALVYHAGGGGAFSRPHGKIYASLAWLGDISYGIYIYHFPLMGLAWLVLKNTRHAFPYGMWQMLLVLPCVTAFSAASHYLVERPANVFGRKLADRLTKWIARRNAHGG